MSSFDNLVARKGSPSNSFRSASTNTSASNTNETRDIGRQSERRARMDHRRAIQVRKIAFLVLVLLLLLGGLSYAIYKVVSNDSEENESAKVKLEEDKLSSIKTVFQSSTTKFLDESREATSGATPKMASSTAKLYPQSTRKMQQGHSSSLKEAQPVPSSVRPTPGIDITSTQALKSVSSSVDVHAELSSRFSTISYYKAKEFSGVQMSTLSVGTDITTQGAPSLSGLFATDSLLRHVQTSKIDVVIDESFSSFRGPLETSGIKLGTKKTLSSGKEMQTMKSSLTPHEMSSVINQPSSSPDLQPKSLKTSPIKHETGKTSTLNQEMSTVKSSFTAQNKSLVIELSRSFSDVPPKDVKTSMVTEKEYSFFDQMMSTVKYSSVPEGISSSVSWYSKNSVISSEQLMTTISAYEKISEHVFSSTFSTVVPKLLQPTSSHNKHSSVKLFTIQTSNQYAEETYTPVPSPSNDISTSESMNEHKISISFSGTENNGSTTFVVSYAQALISPSPSSAFHTSSLIREMKTSDVHTVTLLARPKASVNITGTSVDLISSSINSNSNADRFPSPTQHSVISLKLSSTDATERLNVTQSPLNSTAMQQSPRSGHATHELPTPSMLSNTPLTINQTTIYIVGQSAVNYSLNDLIRNTVSPSKTESILAPSYSVWENPYYLSWSNWSDCSQDCGGGFQYRTRNCSKVGECGVVGPSTNKTTCNMHKCNETTFEVYLNMTDHTWTDDYYNTSSAAYIGLKNNVMQELQQLYGVNVSAQIAGISRGSVIVVFTITLSVSETINDLTTMVAGGKLGNLSVTLIKVINNMVPSRPTSIFISNTTLNSTLISWNRLHDNVTNGILLGYKLLISPGNMTFHIQNPDTTSIKANNLMPETSYTVQLLGYNINGDGMKTSDTFTTMDRPPHYLPWGEWSNCSRECGGGITLRTRNCSKEGLCLHLGESEQRQHCNVYKCNKSSYSVGLNVTNVEWTDDLHNTSSQAYKELLAKFIAELQKKYPNATISLGSITKGSVIFEFLINFPDNQKKDLKTITEELEDEGLGNYTADVKTIENKNLPSRPPSSINITMITHHSAKISWLPISEEDSNGAILGYMIALLSRNTTTKLNMSVEPSDVEFNHHLNKLLPNITYRFHMYGYNVNGKGVNSDTISFTTKVEIPKINSVIVSNVRTTQSVLKWSAIPDNKNTYEVILSYKILLSTIHKTKELKIIINKTRVDFVDLLPNAVYNETILGYNDFGDGVISKVYAFTTMDMFQPIFLRSASIDGLVGLEGVIQIPKIKSVNVSHVTTTYSVLKWSAIPDNKNTYGVILGYKIILSTNRNTQELEVPANETRVNLVDLSSNTVYNATIFGYNDFGDGVINDVYTFTTMALIPKPNITVINITSDATLVAWSNIDVDEKGHGNLKGYKIIVKKSEILVMHTTTADLSYIILRNLSSNATYCVHVLGYNQYGDGLPSEIHCFTTKAIKIEPYGTFLTSSHLLSSTTKSSVIKEQPITGENLKLAATTLSETKMLSSAQRARTATIISKTHTSHSSHNKSSAINFSKDTSIKSASVNHLQNSQVLQSSTSSVYHRFVQSSTEKINIPSAIVTSTPHYNQQVHSLTYTSSLVSSIIKKYVSSIPLPLSISPSISLHYPQHLRSSESRPVTTNPPQTNPKEDEYIEGQIRFTDENFSDDYNNRSSKKYKELATVVEKSLESLFKNKGMEVEDIVVYGFIEGSVIVQFYIVVLKELNYRKENVTIALLEASRNGGLDSRTFSVDPNDFSIKDQKPTTAPTAKEGNQGLQKNEEEDDTALIVAVVICVLLVVGIMVIVGYIGKKRNWFKRGRRKIVPEDDDDDEEDETYAQTDNSRLRLKTARGSRKQGGQRINGGYDNTEC